MSFTSASSLSMGSGDALADPRVQRVKRSDSFCAPIPPPKDIKPVTPLKESTVGIKRPPSFGTLAQEARRDMQQSANVPEAIKDSSYPSSDEEEKIRSKSAKKLKVKEPASADKKAKTKLKEPASPDRKARAGSPRSPQPKVPPGVPTEAPAEAAVGTKCTKRVRPGAMNLQRNPSIFGPELPHLRSVSPAQSPRARIPTSPVAMPAPITSPVLQKLSASPELAPATPPKGKTLRRVQRLALGRRISFGSLVSPPEDADAESDDEDGGCLERLRQRELGQLGSAFQLH
jgi:transcription factor SPN1